MVRISPVFISLFSKTIAFFACNDGRFRGFCNSEMRVFVFLYEDFSFSYWFCSFFYFPIILAQNPFFSSRGKVPRYS